MSEWTRRLGYLSGALRVSTRDAAESSGPRSHVLGVINAFEEIGWKVLPYIAGDRVPVGWVSAGSREKVSGSTARRVAADFMRIGSAMRNSRRAWNELSGKVDWVYERFGAFQQLGRRFHRGGTPWILETNSPLFQEAVGARKSVALEGTVRRLELQAYRECDVLICISHALERIMVDECGIDPRKIVVMANGVDTSVFNPDRVTAKRVTNGFVVGFVGNMYAWAGLDMLLRCIAAARAKGTEVSAVLVGDGAERQALEALSRELGIAANVVFVGRVSWSEVPAYIGGFDLCYSGQVPVRSVGVMYHSPLKLYEYMAMGRPVIASAFEDAERALSHGKTGFLFEPGDAAALRTVIEDAAAKAGELRHIGDAAREATLRDHSWRSRVIDLIDAVDSILARGSRSPEVR